MEIPKYKEQQKFEALPYTLCEQKDNILLLVYS